MRTDEAMAAYMQAYISKQRLIDGPLNMDGVVEAEQAKLTGAVSIDRVRAFYAFEDQVTRQLQEQIDAFDAQMAALTPDILPFFSGKGHDTYVFFRAEGLQMSVVDTAITITSMLMP